MSLMVLAKAMWGWLQVLSLHRRRNSCLRLLMFSIWVRERDVWNLKGRFTLLFLPLNIFISVLIFMMGLK